MKSAAILMTLLFSVLPCLAQDAHLPDLTGPHAVGTVSRHFIDLSRDEDLTTDDLTDKRELMVQFWYPADVPEGTQPGVYMPEIHAIGPVARIFLTDDGFPTDYENFLASLPAHAVPDAPLASAEARYPVLIFSHAETGLRTQNTYQMEELASHGYIVVAIDHTYISLAVLFPDGRLIPFNPDAVDYLNRLDNSEITRHALDVIFVLDQLEMINADDPAGKFTGRFDLSKPGVIGMSVGGATAGKVMTMDDRFKAGINMDGDPCIDDQPCREGLDQPFMIMLNQSHVLTPGSYDGSDRNGFDPGLLLRSGGYVLQIAGTGHFDFTDFPMTWKLASQPGKYLELSSLGSRSDDPVRVVDIFTEYSLAFFDKHLRGRPVPLLDGPSSDYPEVEFSAFSEIPTAVLAAEEMSPAAFQLQQNYPNPFNARTVLSFQIPRATAVKLEIFSLVGQQVRVLVDEDLPAGAHHRVWDGLDEQGEPVATGVYLYRLEAGVQMETRKLLLLQ